MKSLILCLFVALCAFGSEIMIDSKESFRNNSYIGGGAEFYENSQNSQILENSENSDPSGRKQYSKNSEYFEYLKNSENSNGEILIKKYKKWEDLEDEWLEKYEYEDAKKELLEKNRK